MGAAEHAWWVMFGQRLRAARVDCGLRQEDLAAWLGLTRSSIANVEAGRQRISAYLAARMIAELGMTVPEWEANPQATIAAQRLTEVQQAVGEVIGHAHALTEAAQKIRIV